jgi:hypothetical protein
MSLVRRGFALPLLALLPAVACGRRPPPPAADAGPLDAAAAPRDAAPPSLDAAPEAPRETEVDAATDDAADLPVGGTGPALPSVAPPRLRSSDDLAKLERLCNDGDGLACLRAADVVAECWVSTRPEPGRAARLWQRACGQGRAEGCRRLGLSRLDAADAAATAEDGIDLLDRSCELGSLVACAALGDDHLHGTGTPVDVYRSLLAYQKACNGGYAGACVAVQAARRLAESYDLPLPRVREPEPPKKTPWPENVCPSLLDGALDAGDGPPLDHDLLPLAAETLAAAIPAEVPGWTSTVRGEVEAGAADQRDAAAWATWTSEGRTIEVVVRDRRSDCTLQPGTGTAMRSFREAFTPPPRLVRLAGLDAALVDGAAGRELRLWLGDRCTVVVRGAAPATDDDLQTLAEQLALAPLEHACARREGEGLTP